jgi:hypothetical protein
MRDSAALSASLLFLTCSLVLVMSLARQPVIVCQCTRAKRAVSFLWRRWRGGREWSRTEGHRTTHCSRPRDRCLSCSFDGAARRLNSGVRWLRGRETQGTLAGATSLAHGYLLAPSSCRACAPALTCVRAQGSAARGWFLWRQGRGRRE